ncbi:MAG: hypothetical protein M1822_006772 [Bathelium mastoideum]|nr:MAG: hypothetical protein M1822_006772 [Bathelium mastoideum]
MPKSQPAEEILTQVQDLAFNTNGWATNTPDRLFTDCWEAEQQSTTKKWRSVEASRNRTTNIIGLKARERSAVKHRTAIDELKSKKIIRNSLGLTKAETETLDSVTFGMYRDETTVKANRGSNWNRRRLKLPPEQPLPLCLQKKQARHTRAHDLTKTIVEPRKSFLNEVLALTSGFAETREIWCLEELEKALDLAEKNLEFRPLHENTASHMFVDGQDRIDEGTANLMKAELVKIWPELGDITEENILRMSRGLMRYREREDGND